MRTFIQVRKILGDQNQSIVEYEFDEKQGFVGKLNFGNEQIRDEKIKKEQALAEIKRALQEAGK